MPRRKLTTKDMKRLIEGTPRGTFMVRPRGFDAGIQADVGQIEAERRRAYFAELRAGTNNVLVAPAKTVDRSTDGSAEQK